MIFYQLPNPVFRMNLARPGSGPGGFWGHEWLPDSEITVTVDDPVTAAVPDFTSSATSDEWGNFDLPLAEELPRQARGEVTVSDGASTKTTVVSSLTVTDIDVDADTVSGTVEAQGSVTVQVYTTDEDSTSRWVTANDEGNWTADFSVEGTDEWQFAIDIRPGVEGSAYQEDEDGDWSGYFWRVPNPVFHIDAQQASFWGEEWPADTDIAVAIDDPGTAAAPDFSAGARSDEWGNFDLQFAEDDYDAKPGDEVTVSDGATTKTTTVTSLTVIEADLRRRHRLRYGGARQRGQGPGLGRRGESRGPVPVRDGGRRGCRTADFSEPADDQQNPDENRAWDLADGSNGPAFQFDVDGDATQVGWHVSGPRIVVRPTWEIVEGFDLQPGADVTLTADDPATPASPDVVHVEPADELGGVWFSLWGDSQSGPADFDIAEGWTVTLDDGVSLKSHLVTALRWTALDTDASTVKGVASPGSAVEVTTRTDTWAPPRRAPRVRGPTSWTASTTRPVATCSSRMLTATRPATSGGCRTLLRGSALTKSTASPGRSGPPSRSRLTILTRPSLLTTSPRKASALAGSHSNETRSARSSSTCGRASSWSSPVTRS